MLAFQVNTRIGFGYFFFLLAIVSTKAHTLKCYCSSLKFIQLHVGLEQLLKTYPLARNIFSTQDRRALLILTFQPVVCQLEKLEFGKI